MSAETQYPSIFSLNMKTAFREARHVYGIERYRGVPHRLALLGQAHRIDRTLRKYGEMYMPKKTRATNTAYGFSWVRVALSEQETEKFTAWFAKGAGDLYELLMRMLVEGDKVSMSYSEKQDSFYATVMGSENSHRNQGKGFSSFAKSPEQALALAVFKYHFILEGNMADAPSDDRADFG